MLAIDVPIAVLSGLVLAEGGEKLIKSGDDDKRLFLRVFALMYAAIFIAPITVYFFLGWPAWEVNYMWEWVDDILDKPHRAGFAFVLLACAVVPTFLGLELGGYLIRKGKEKWVRIGYIAMLVLTGLIILALYDMTFNVFSTHEKYRAGESYSFWTFPFVAGWAITAAYFWGSLIVFYLWLKKRS